MTRWRVTPPTRWHDDGLVLAGFPHGNALRHRHRHRPLAEVVPAVGESKLELGFLYPGQHSDPAKTAVSADDYLDVVGKDYVVDARAVHDNDKGLLGSGLHEGRLGDGPAADRS